MQNKFMGFEVSEYDRENQQCSLQVLEYSLQ